MATSRRAFLRTAAAGAVVPMFGPAALDALERRLEPFDRLSPSAAATDDQFWAEVRKVFPVPADYINLENGYSSPQPAPTFEAFQRHQAAINGGLSFYMRRKKAGDLENVKRQLAELAGCPVEELVITRNTTESLGTVIHGIDLAPGDEAVMCNQDYGSMLEQFRQQSRRRGLTCVEVDLPLHPASDEAIVDTYARALTPRTRLLLVSHMVNITGQTPGAKDADMAHAHGVDVIVDAATRSRTWCSPCRTWAATTSAPACTSGCARRSARDCCTCARRKSAASGRCLATPACPPTTSGSSSTSARTPHGPCWPSPTPSASTAWWGASAKKRASASFSRYWTDRVRGIGKVYLNTPGGTRACGIANVGITGLTPTALADALFDRFRIYTVAIDTGPVKGARVTPHLCTTTAELDALVKAITALAA